jgi:outer membrane protein TolC
MTDQRRVDRKPQRPAARTTRGTYAGLTAALAAGLGLAGAAETADAQLVTTNPPPALPPTSSPGPGAGTIPTVTLADALHQALRPDNPVLQQQADSVAGAAGRLQAAGGQFDWHADVSGGWQQFYVATPNNQGLLTTNTTIESGYYYQVDMGKEFRNGIQIAPGIISYPGTAATPGQTAGQTETRPLLGLVIPFMRSSGDAVDAPERAAREALQAARSNRAFAEQQLAQQVAVTYWRCIADARLVINAEDMHAHEDAYRNTLQKQVEKGVTEPNAVKQFTLTHLTDKINVDHAEDDEAKCRRDLAYLLTGTLDQAGVGAPAPVGEMPDVAVLGPAVDKLRDEDLVLLALDQRQDLEAAARNLAAAHENVVGAETLMKPQLDVHIDPQRAFVTFSRPFGNNLGKGRTADARAQENSAIVTMRQLQDQVRTQVDDALTALRRARADWVTLNAAEAQMATLVSDTEKRARLGASMSTGAPVTWADYLAAQNQLSVLNQQEINTRLVFALNLSLLELAIGAMDTDRPTDLAKDLATVPKTP